MLFQGKRVSDVVNRIHVAVPKARDNLARPPVIPPGVEAARARRDAGDKRRTEKELQVVGGGGGDGELHAPPRQQSAAAGSMWRACCTASLSCNRPVCSWWPVLITTGWLAGCSAR